MQPQEWLLLCGVAAGPFFIIVFLIEGILRQGYYPMRQPVSALAIGRRGWIQQVNFFVTGALALAYAIGLHGSLSAYGESFWLPLLIGLFAVGLLGAGAFVTDVTGLWELGASPVKRTTSGIIHDAFSLPVFASLCVSTFMFAYHFIKVGEGGWAAYSIVSGVALAVCFVLAGAGFSGSPKFVQYGGLWQRLSICAGWVWLSLVAFNLLGW